MKQKVKSGLGTVISRIVRNFTSMNFLFLFYLATVVLHQVSSDVYKAINAIAVSRIIF